MKKRLLLPSVLIILMLLSCNDDNNDNPTPSIDKYRISSILSIDNKYEYKVLYQFIYDKNFTAVEAYRNELDWKTGDVSFREMYKLERDNNGLVTKIAIKYWTRKSTEWEDFGTWEISYTNGKISYINVYGHIYGFTWSNNKITKGTKLMPNDEEDLDITEFKYNLQGNCDGYNKTSTKGMKTKSMKIEYDESPNYLKLLPMEFRILMSGLRENPYELCNESNMKKVTLQSTDIISDPNTGDSTYRNDLEYINTITYTFNENNCIDTETNTSTYKSIITDYKKPENNSVEEAHNHISRKINYIKVTRK